MNDLTNKQISIVIIEYLWHHTKRLELFPSFSLLFHSTSSPLLHLFFFHTHISYFLSILLCPVTFSVHFSSSLLSFSLHTHIPGLKPSPFAAVKVLYVFSKQGNINGHIHVTYFSHPSCTLFHPSRSLFLCVWLRKSCHPPTLFPKKKQQE